MALDPNEHAVVSASCRVIDLVQAVCDSWRFPSNLNHAVATAGMKRAADLISEAFSLVERRPSVGANILVRSAFECWLVGVWALLGGDDALLGIEKERVRNERNLATSVTISEAAIQYLNDQQTTVSDLSEKLLGTDAPSSVKYEEMARVLPSHIKEQTPDHEEVDVLAVYDLLYRSHSTYDAHPWKVIGQYVQEGELGLRVKSVPAWQDPVISGAVMTMYVARLGGWIEHARGGAGDRWGDALSDLERLLRSAEESD